VTRQPGSLADDKRALLNARASAHELRRGYVDELLPEPLLFGRGRWRSRRRAALAILQREYSAQWFAIILANTHDAMHESLGVPDGPREAARRAVEEASRSTDPKETEQ
jgi:hypothetical protein